MKPDMAVAAAVEDMAAAAAAAVEDMEVAEITPRQQATNMNKSNCPINKCKQIINKNNSKLSHKHGELYATSIMLLQSIHPIQFMEYQREHTHTL